MLELSVMVVVRGRSLRKGLFLESETPLLMSVVDSKYGNGVVIETVDAVVVVVVSKYKFPSSVMTCCCSKEVSSLSSNSLVKDCDIDIVV